MPLINPLMEQLSEHISLCAVVSSLCAYKLKTVFFVSLMIEFLRLNKEKNTVKNSGDNRTTRVQLFRH